jgi:hypothetical protein
MREIVEVDPYRYVTLETGKIVEVDRGETKILRITESLNYTSNKMTFVVGTTNGTPVSDGDKHTYGTRINDGRIYQWVISTDVPTTLSARIRKSSAYPTFSDLLALNLTVDAYATGAVSIPIQHLDILDLVIDSNDLAQRVSIELFIR